MICWLLAVAVAAEPPTADLAEEADLHFSLGVQALKARDYRAALDHLLQSQRLAPNKNTAFNLALCYEQLGRPDQAWRHYTAARDDGPDGAAIDRALAALARQVARVAVRSDPPGATVYVDRRDLGRRGVTPTVLALPPGEHRVLLDLDGHAAAEVDAVLELGREAPVTVTLAPDAAPAGDEPGPRWVRSEVRAGDVVVLRAEPGRCDVLPDLVSGAATWVAPSGFPAEPPGASAALDARPPLALDVTVAGDGAERTTRLTLARADQKAAWLADAAPLRSWILDRCQVTDGAAVAAALAGLPKPVRLEAAAVLAELGSSPLGDEAAACARGDCAALGAGL